MTEAGECPSQQGPDLERETKGTPHRAVSITSDDPAMSPSNRQSAKPEIYRDGPSDSD